MIEKILFLKMHMFAYGFFKNNLVLQYLYLESDTHLFLHVRNGNWYITQQADTYLARKYGNYMVIPDGDHQRQHNFHVLDFDKPYSSYQASEQ